MSMLEDNGDFSCKAILDMAAKGEISSVENMQLTFQSIYQKSIAISLKRIADTLDNFHDHFEIQGLTKSIQPDQPPTPHNTFKMMYENKQDKEHSTRNDMK